MKPSKEIIEFIKQKEGFREKAYKPLKSDVWTIGYGFTYWKGRSVKFSDTITREEADKELERILCEEYANKLTTSRKVDQHQFDAIVSLAYNVGIFRFLKSETWKLFQEGRDISDRFTLWAQFKGQVIPGLMSRREAEAKIYKEGKYA